jgi:ABC-type transporter Mla MlaB component
VNRVTSTYPPELPKQWFEARAQERAANMNDESLSGGPGGPGRARTGRVVLGACCTINEVDTLRDHLLEQAALPGPYEIDGGSVEQVDTAGVQLVLAFALDCLEQNIHYTWIARSAVLEDAIRVLNVGALLESPGSSAFAPGGKTP